MSMLSAQCDKLRELADRFDGLAPENAALMRSVADTIWELRCKLNDEWDENAKLRELVKDMCVWAYINDQCDLEDEFADRMRKLGVGVDA